MARREKLTKSKTLYTLRQQHALTTIGQIMEQDLVTILPNDIYDDTENISVFKYRINNSVNRKKRHIRGAWITPPNSSATSWTIADLSGHTKTKNGKVVLKPRYTSLSDFACYGSAIELIRTSIKDICLRFPGGLQYYKTEFAPTVIVKQGEDLEQYYIVSNECEINWWSEDYDSELAKINPLRLLSLSYSDYVDSEGNPIEKPETRFNGTHCPESIVGSTRIAGKDFLIYLNNEGKYILVTQNNGEGVIIKPKQEIIDKFWDTLDDFERVLLNKETTPAYKSVFNWYYMTEDGYFMEPRTFIWPTVNNDGITPDMTTGSFNGYLSSLIELAAYHDNIDSDNLWRMNTHESIKNLNWAFSSTSDDYEELDSSKMENLIHVYGRIFDDLKRSIDNIKQTNTITYNENGNLPDYFLTDKADLEGWDCTSICNSMDRTISSPEIKTEDDIVIYKEGKTVEDVNLTFLRRLCLSSHYLQSLKGTRRGIEVMLGLFGYKPEADETGFGTYTINEYIAVAHKYPLYYDACSLRTTTGEYVNSDEHTNFMWGYPVLTITPTEGPSYLVPWFDKNEEYNDPFYFQSKGGWGKIDKTPIFLDITTIKTLKGNDEVSLYRESENCMRYASNISEMLSISHIDAYDNMLCYVTDISGLVTDEYKAKEGDEGTFSHYFILKNSYLSTFLGYVKTETYDCYGWKNVYLEEFNNEATLTNDGIRVLYLESITTKSKGNNPHIGKNMYDMGDEYLDRFNRIFGVRLDRGEFDFLEEENPEKWNQVNNDMGFDCEYVIDNSKCHYFSDGDNVLLTEDEVLENSLNMDFYNNLTNNEDAPKHDESSSFSVINTKKIEIIFHTGGVENTYFEDYIIKVVLPYLESMIPSTAILTYKFSD